MRAGNFQPLVDLPEYYQDISVVFDSGSELTILCCTDSNKQGKHKVRSFGVIVIIIVIANTPPQVG